LGLLAGWQPATSGGIIAEATLYDRASSAREQARICSLSERTHPLERRKMERRR
jgi:hypothetical protein